MIAAAPARFAEFLANTAGNPYGSLLRFSSTNLLIGATDFAQELQSRVFTAGRGHC